ncbi:MAG: hypothetical protein FWG87_11710 [Defluviitaleaceae bacterium]|nr:hypothetical protein [Defluviitaleaceae bacterium]
MSLSPIASFAATPEVIYIEIENVLSGMSEFSTEPMVVAGSDHTVALKADGTVWAWGGNGLAGDGTIGTRYTPVQVYGLSNVTAISAGYDHTVALKNDGTVWAWGRDYYGQLGVGGGTYQRYTPAQVTDLNGVTAIAAGINHTVALKDDGTVWAWGYNTWGQLGDGTTALRLTPVQVTDLSNVKAISAGEWHTVALKDDGTVWAWGSNTRGLLGIGEAITTESLTPIQVTDLSNVTAISASSYHTVALKSDGTVWSWGYNTYGQLGIGLYYGSTAPRYTPVQVTGLSDVTSISTGWYQYTVALKNDGTAWTWGNNECGQLGDGTTTDRHTPVRVTDLSNVTTISAGLFRTVALKNDGTVWAWGEGLLLGDGTTAPMRTTPVQVLGVDGVGFLNLRNSTPTTGFNTYPMVGGGNYHTAALKDDGTVWAWGSNEYGQLGDGTTTNRHTPVQVYGLINVTAISGNGWHNAALRADGTVWTWGYNGFGQLGNGTITDRYTPIRANGLSDVTAISTGYYHTVALKDNGTVWAWGHNEYGQLGDGTTTNRNSPVQVTSLSNVRAISAGAWHTAALKDDGTVWIWGHNGSAQLGLGDVTDRHTPVQVAGLSDVKAVSASGGHTVALKNDGTVWAWGWNDFGQVGDGTTVSVRYTPVKVTSLDNVTTISGQYGHTVAIKNDGTAWAWGNNEYGQLGDGTTTNRNTPVQITSLDTVTAISAGGYYTVALKYDGTVWTWGFNWEGQLGDGTALNHRYTPIQVHGEGGVGFLNLGATALGDLYIVVFDLNGGTRTGGGEIKQTVPPKGAATTPTVTYSGWVLDGWDISFANVNKNIIEITAQWLRLGAITNMGESVSSADVVWLARHVAGHAGFELSEQDKHLVDINGDGVVDSADITALMRWLVGWELGELQG